MKDQRKATTLSLIMLALLVAFIKADFLVDVTTWLWKQFVLGVAIGFQSACWSFGGWGLLFDNDDGKIIDQCY